MASGRPVSHPLFARGFDRAAHKLEDRGQRENRQKLLSGLAGRVIEIGAGNGLMLCSVYDQRQALAEVRRVLRPGGELRFYEHVRAQGRYAARAQQAFDLVWPLIGGGCHTSRDTLAAISEAGFEIARCERFLFKPMPLALPTAPHILGSARRL